MGANVHVDLLFANLQAKMFSKKLKVNEKKLFGMTSY